LRVASSFGAGNCSIVILAWLLAETAGLPVNYRPVLWRVARRSDAGIHPISQF
jgi:hypothetical protein